MDRDITMTDIYTANFVHIGEANLHTYVHSYEAKLYTYTLILYYICEANLHRCVYL